MTPGYRDMVRRTRPTQPYGVHPVWRYNTKLASRELAALADVQAPEVYAVADALDALPEPDRPAVLKPNNGSGGKSVHLLSPNGDGTHVDLLAGVVRTWAEVIDLAGRPRTRRLNRDNVEPPWLVEELLLDEAGRLLCDWKFWCFGGEPAVVMQRSHRPPGGKYGHKWWSPQWEELGCIRPRPRIMEYRPDLPLPTMPSALLDAARRVAAHVPAAFVRVDLYDTARGPVFGEITPWPGGTEPFVPEWECRLGHLWERAERMFPDPSPFERG